MLARSNKKSRASVLQIHVIHTSLLVLRFFLGGPSPDVLCDM
jgi:hypothetical protein